MTHSWEIRRDLMARWFAVAISVGFATTLVRMKWLNAGGLPDAAESQQLARLFVAIAAVLFSWEGYFLSIGKKPLETSSRFYIDFALVAVYMVLLYTSSVPSYWIYLHTFSFVLYVWWDILTIRQYRDQYARDEAAGARLTRIYAGSATGAAGFYRGPFVTVAWGACFVGISVFQILLGSRNSWVLLPFIIFALYQYRGDKRTASDDWRDRQSTYRAKTTVALIVLVWAAVFAVFTFYHGAALGPAPEKSNRS